MENQTYSSTDLAAAQNMLELHFAKLKKAAAQGNYPEVCMAILALENESANAGRIAASLSLSKHLEQVPRMSRGANY